MSEKKLSEELRHCLEDDACGDCQYHEPETKLICRGLLQKAYERIKKHEEMFPCKVGDKLYCPNQYTKMIAVFEVVEIYTFKDGTVIIDDLENEWTIEDIGKTAFLTRPEAGLALAEMEGKK